MYVSHLLYNSKLAVLTLSMTAPFRKKLACKFCNKEICIISKIQKPSYFGGASPMRVLHTIWPSYAQS